MGQKKKLYEVRIREKIGPDKYMKKSKFYWAVGPKEAVEHYKGQGHIMYAEKVVKDKLLGIGSFFKLGNDLLKEFNLDVSLETRVQQKISRGERRFNSQRKEALKEV